MSDTPRTDAVSERAFECDDWGDPIFDYEERYEQMRDFARQLERENKRLREALERIKKGYSGDYENCQGLSGTDCAEIASAALEDKLPKTKRR